MAAEWSLSEFAALLGRPQQQIERWRAASVLDPSGSGSFDELDLVRLLTIERGEADGYGPEQLAQALRSGEVRAFLADYLYPDGPALSLDEAAKRADVDLMSSASCTRPWDSPVRRC